jgi:phenylalanyl-tRNA synthetase beta chain
MKVSLSWLQDYIIIDIAPERLADQLTMVGLEVEGLNDRFNYLSQVLVARIEAVEPHPQADKLKLCRVRTGDRTYQVVCGAPNSEAGLTAPLALPGAILPGEVKIAAGKIRGQISEGMLCSAGELGLGADRSGLMALDTQLLPGTPLNRALQLSDAIFDVNLTPNRPDCLSVLGIAREIAGFTQQPLKRPEIRLPKGYGDIRQMTSVAIEAPDHCPRYSMRLLDNISVGPSPFWLQDRLLSVGLRPISNLVDITNYILMETGQPLHAFDFDRLEENRIVVRTAKSGELFTTLDGKERRLEADMLMICDGRKPVAVGGVMGGLNSEIADDTRRVLIESAYFTPSGIRRTAKRMGLNTEASHRFERGIDPQGTLYAVDRAAQLMVELGGGRLIEGVIDATHRIPHQPPIKLSVAATNRLLGTQLKSKQIADTLQAIAFEVVSADPEVLTVNIPSFRVDVSRPEDLMEEVARRHGYDHIPVTFPAIPPSGTAASSRLWSQRQRLRRIFTGLGFCETINYSFVHQTSADRLCLVGDDERRRQLPILNPLSDEQSVMRTSLVPGLLETAQRNIAHQSRTLKLFEIGKIFIARSGEDLPQEREMIGVLWTGQRRESVWYAKSEPCDFYDLKGAIEGLFYDLKLDAVQFTRLPEEACFYTQPGASAHISAGGVHLGIIAEIRPQVCRAYDIKQPVYFCELELDGLLNRVIETPQSKPLPKFPSTERDFTLVVDMNVETAAMIDFVRRMEESWVEEVRLIDLFRGKPIPERKKSVTIRITYRAADATLEDETVNRLHSRITERLTHQFGMQAPA